MSERTWSKLGALAATVVLLVVAFSGGFATYAAFTDSEHAGVTFSTGTITGPPNGPGAAGNAACETGGPANVPAAGGNAGNAGNAADHNGNAGNNPEPPCSTGQQTVAPSIGAQATPALRR